MNPKVATLKGQEKYWAKKSMKLPLQDLDLADPEIMSRILRHSSKDYNISYPKEIGMK